MIEAIIFDFGDVFLNLDKEATVRELKKLGLKEWTPELEQLNYQYEIGKIDELEFMCGIQKHIAKCDILAIREAWNAILLDFPLYRLEFLQLLSGKFRLFLLSNTDQTHIDKFEHKVGQSFARDFYGCFEKVYFSYDIHLRKPDENAFKFVINNHNLIPKKTLFIDDKKENINAAKKLGFVTWNLQVGKEDVTQLFEKNLL
ncbi:HAD family hydrolase [Flavobacterium tibetense]|jgi:glucose-1-phosphatase|uniref:HAD family phosphatase n=1 Tax=Flavobacterium tibetense TaxID=2233533 RepID=A0A365P3V2_9FLAO|nr:HAD family phosphatase [Flavobacterium tibetense]RBA29244.1 HAD family phosphatase [Flavobacterium tibetense]